MPTSVSPATLKQWLHDGQEIALLDIREAGQFGESHLFYAIPLPYSRLEIDVVRLVPRLDTRIVVHDGGQDDVATRAARRLEALGYGHVHVLEGGTAAWAAAGYRLFQGVNLPSKTFGELVEQRRHTPRISAEELARRQAAGDKLVVLDGRPYDEYRKMNIPGALSCPNGELALRIGQFAPDIHTTVVVNCAGRTRSIIGAETLIAFGIPNPVMALENGTQGWFLADLELQHGSTRSAPDNTLPSDLADRRLRATSLAERHGVKLLSDDQAQLLVDDPARSCFVLDVRTPEEFAAGTLAGARHAPGGQLQQATDQYVGVRNARLLLLDSDGVRALVVASWLRQIGFEADVLANGVTANLRLSAAPASIPPAAPQLSTVAPEALAQQLSQGRVAAIDLRPGMAYRSLHAQGLDLVDPPPTGSSGQNARKAARTDCRQSDLGTAGCHRPSRSRTARSDSSRRRPGGLALSQASGSSQPRHPQRHRLHRLPVLRTRPPRRQQGCRPTLPGLGDRPDRATRRTGSRRISDRLSDHRNDPARPKSGAVLLAVNLFINHWS